MLELEQALGNSNQELEKSGYSLKDLEGARLLLENHPELADFAMQGFYFNVFSLKDLSNPCFLEQKRQKLDTAHHEHGHAIAAKALGWNVAVISIVREGNTLGFTRAVPGTPKPIEELLLDKIAICYAGMAAETLMGNNDHRGCASDIGQAVYLAEVVANFNGWEKDTVGGILQSGWQRAWDIMSSYGKTHVDNVSFPMLNNPVKT